MFGRIKQPNTHPEIIMEKLYQCSICKDPKPKNSFYKRKNRPKGIASACKACSKLRTDNYIKNNKEKRKQTVRKWVNKNTDRMREHWRKYNKNNSDKLYALMISLKQNPCMDCGNSFPHYVMDFDHRDPATKHHCVSRVNKFRTEKKLLEEIAKCDLVCSNCHRIRTYTRNHSS